MFYHSRCQTWRHRKYIRYVCEYFFEHYDFDVTSVAPYMGRERPLNLFFNMRWKWVIVLGLTSNPGANDFEMLQTEKGRLYEQVITSVANWGQWPKYHVCGKACNLPGWKARRTIVPNHFIGTRYRCTGRILMPPVKVVSTVTSDY